MIIFTIIVIISSGYSGGSCRVSSGINKDGAVVVVAGEEVVAGDDEEGVVKGSCVLVLVDVVCRQGGRLDGSRKGGMNK